MPTSFLLKEEFVTIISIAALDNLSNNNDDVIDTMIVEAILEMMSYLGARYDDLEELLAEDGLLHPTLKMYCKDIVLYHLHSRHHQKQMPQIREKRYLKALQWLADVQAQKINPFAFMDIDVETNALVKAGGNTKRNNYQE